MATQAQITAFIGQIGPLMVKYAKANHYQCVSAAIAQACLESAFGTCALSKYHNYFGLKAGSSWKGEVVNMRTMEEYKVGTLTAIVDGFRAYDSMEAGVAGYYGFLAYSRYRTVKDQTTPEAYLKEIKAAGYATSSTYVQNNMRIVNTYGLKAWDAVLHGTAAEIPTIAAITTMNPPEYTVGKVYQLSVELNVRTDAGTWARKLTHDELTLNAKQNDRDRDGALDRGTRVTCQEVQKDGSDVWIRIPSGWVAAYYKGNTYIRAVA